MPDCSKCGKSFRFKAAQEAMDPRPPYTCPECRHAPKLANDPLKDPVTLAANLRADADDMKGLIGKGILARMIAAADLLEAAATAPATDPDDDARDGVLFRFWIRAGSYPGGWPARLSELFREHGPKGKENVEPRHYRAALMALAKEKGVNLP